MHPTYEQTIQRALDATRRDALDESEALLQQAMALEPGAGMPHYLRATNFAHAGRYELAEASYVACLNRMPEFAIARFQLGLLQLTGGRAALAQASWEPLLGLADDHPLKLFVLGFVAILGEQWETARVQIERGIALNRDNAPLNADMAAVLERLAQIDAPQTPQAQAEAPRADESQAHFLIGAYRVH
jgi:tetratricopeptide (TPR) repeat protein